MSPELKNVAAVSVIFCLFGLGFGGFGGYRLWQAHDFARTAVRATGTVVGFERRTSKPYPIYEFADSEKQVHRGTSISYSSSDSYSVGSSVAILYAPEDPNVSCIGGFGHQYAMPLGFAGLGTLVFLAGIVGGIAGYKTYKT